MPPQTIGSARETVGVHASADLLHLLHGAVRSQWPLWLGVLAGIIPTVAFQTLQPLVFRAVIDQAIIPRDAARLVILIALLAGLIVLRLLGEIAREHCAVRVATRFISGLRLQLFDHLQQLGQDFFSRTDSGKLLFTYTNDLTTLEAALTHEFPIGVRDSVALLACGALLFTIDWRLALASVLLVLLVASVPRWFGGAAQRAGDRLQRDAATAAALVNELLGVQAVITAFGLHHLARGRVRDALNRQSASSTRFGLYSGAISALVGPGSRASESTRTMATPAWTGSGSRACRCSRRCRRRCWPVWRSDLRRSALWSNRSSLVRETRPNGSTSSRVAPSK